MTHANGEYSRDDDRYQPVKLSDASRRISDAEPVLIRLEAALLALHLAIIQPDYEYTPETPPAIPELMHLALERARAEVDELHRILLGPETVTPWPAPATPAPEGL